MCTFIAFFSLCARTMFFSTGLLLQSLWTLLRYFKPKVSANVQYEPKDPPVGIARSPRLKLKLFVFAQSNGSLSAAAAVALARQVSLRRWWRHRFALHRRRHRHQHAKHTHTQYHTDHTYTCQIWSAPVKIHDNANTGLRARFWNWCIDRNWQNMNDGAF